MRDLRIGPISIGVEVPAIDSRWLRSRRCGSVLAVWIWVAPFPGARTGWRGHRWTLGRARARYRSIERLLTGPLADEAEKIS